MSKSIAFLASLLCVVFSAGNSYAQDHGTAGQWYEANSKNPGAAVNIFSVIAKQGQTVFFIHSPHCGPCRKMFPHVKKLVEVKPNIKIVDILLDRKTASGIGWDSPAAKQFHIHEVPYFIIYNHDGTVAARGKRAEEQVQTWIDQTGV